MTVKGLIFDLDGTVTLTQQFHAKAFGIVFKRHGLDYTETDDARYSGRGAHCTFPEFFQEHGIALTPEQVEEYAAEKHAEYRKIIRSAEIKTVPGVVKFLERQKARGMKIAMATGNRVENADELLTRANIKHYFEEIITNRDVKKSKPEPDIFLKAAERLGLKPDECLVLEDAVNGVTAARKAGMRCIATDKTTPKEKLLEAGAERVIGSFEEVTDDIINQKQ
jgi:beta-phosphoglucomutase